MAKKRRPAGNLQNGVGMEEAFEKSNPPKGEDKGYPGRD